MDNRNIIQNVALIAAMLLLMATSSFGAMVDLSVETEINPEGTKAEIILHYSSAETFAGFDVGLQYNAIILTFTSVELGSEVSNFRMVTSDFSAGDGMIDAVDYSLTGDAGEGDLLRFYFDIAQGAKSQVMCGLNFHDVRFCDPKGNDLPAALRPIPVLLVYGWHGSPGMI
jgi:hypothetical protein